MANSYHTYPSSASTGGGTSEAQGGSLSGLGNSRRRRNQQRASGHRRKEAASRQHQLLSACMKLKNLCINGKLTTTSHISVMKQLQIKADQFRKQGRLQDQDLHKIIKEIKEGSTAGEQGESDSAN
jgi:hypothetical protein